MHLALWLDTLLATPSHAQAPPADPSDQDEVAAREAAAGLVTSQVDVTGTDCGPHESVALSSRSGDNCMPTDATSGTPATRADETHVFEAYVRAFCEMDEQ